MSILYKGLILLLLSGCATDHWVNVGHIKNMIYGHEYFCSLSPKGRAIALHHYNNHTPGGAIYLTCIDDPNPELLKDIIIERTHL